jgi:hypothetical protein
MNEVKFVKGLYVQEYDKQKLSFLRAKLSFKTDEFINWLRENTNKKGYCNVDIIAGKDGKRDYAKLNEFKPKQTDDETINIEDAY